MNLKRWLGVLAGGFAMLVVAFALNSPKNVYAGASVTPPDLVMEAPAPPPGPTNPAVAKAVVRPEKQPPASLPTGTRSKPERSAPAAPKRAAAPSQPAPKEASSIKAEPGASGVREVQESPPSPAGSSSSAATSKGRVIHGIVTYVGKKRTNRVIDMSADGICAAAAAGKKIRKESYILHEKRLANVVVYLDKVPKGTWPVPKTAIHIEQKGCVYRPHAVAFMLGQKITITNEDPTTHNVHWTSRKNSDWNKSQSTQGESMSPIQPFRREEIGTASFKCDIHPWMECKAYIFNHPFFALTNELGEYSINCAGLPDGEYVVKAYHEKFKTKYREGDRKGRIKVKLTKDGATLNITFTGKKKKRR